MPRTPLIPSREEYVFDNTDDSHTAISESLQITNGVVLRFQIITKIMRK